MDGGLSSNNPSSLALQETHRLAPGFKRPDQLVSVGTGRRDSGHSGSASCKYGNNSLYQTAQHYWRNNFDGDKQFASMRQTMIASAAGSAGEIDAWFRRFNLPLHGQLPDLADADAIDSLAEAARSYFESHQPIQELALSSIALLFYFELRCRPIYENGRYTCYGRVLCRISALDPGFSMLVEKLEAAKARFVVNGRTLPTTKSKVVTLDQSGNFSKPACLRVSSLSDSIDMYLKLEHTQLLPISASPSSIASFVKLQRLDWPGSHGTRSIANGSRKRAAPSTTTIPPTKRPCAKLSSE
jgi:hypothetical protein